MDREKLSEKKLGNWKGKLLSVGERLILINLMLTSLTIFMLFFLKFLEEFFKIRLLSLVFFLAK